jgi:hypothetical protein
MEEEVDDDWFGGDSQLSDVLFSDDEEMVRKIYIKNPLFCGIFLQKRRLRVDKAAPLRHGVRLRVVKGSARSVSPCLPTFPAYFNPFPSCI